MSDITSLEYPPPVTKVLLIGTVAVTLCVGLSWNRRSSCIANEDQIGAGGHLATDMGE